ncbi:hypothetical protein [Klebsiella phage ZCKP8]|uniref:hypothetical protein n=1 Tax=Klebsiella phage vB_Kpn_ZCKp20p TaxID=2981580 RepID=UPI001CE5AB2F|nr:hypothetical protein PRB86_gp23 [Klebsiella phage vB_Kpn_ZCKp20p]YP_010685601.1 hypothetical protein PRB87_gp23 [Klebsiella phage ZCKP8]YP_010685680.1 hypothetical protein PRB88_gp18 [Klebsiella phage vB_Kpn_ZC2]QYW02930.1 hypothetical protein [Klebsiella phage ZCKP8]UXQ88404.1 hypothetical protein [Klebsiella phage vB_Kpn_ZCKp20p]UZN98689.1 hypothetical protein [Klebsiella phage vB_Kpn_ZC2]
MKLIDILVEELPKCGGWDAKWHQCAQDGNGEVCFFTSGEIHFRWIFDAWSIPPDSVSRHDGKARLEALLADDYSETIITREQYEAALADKNDGWIEWGGGECPVPEGTLVDVKYRDGVIKKGLQALIVNSGRSASRLFWVKDNIPTDIIAYRLHQTQQVARTEAEQEEDLNECIGQDSSTAWSVRWLPSSGCECEYQYKVHGSEWCSFECVAVDGNVAFGWSNNTPIALQLNTHNFRPMRSNAERRRDDAKHAIAELCRSSASNGHAADLIYDAIATGKIPGIKLED